MALSPGTKLGPYEIQSPLGAGGMGEVYRARDTRLSRDVALKLLPAGALGDATARARLIEEAKTASSLNHPHICTIHDVGESEGQTYVAMEYVEGRPLSQQVPHDGLPLELVMRYGGQIADALAYAHEHGIVHRDLKTANVMITPDGRAKVLDFGLARRLTESELTEGTMSKIPLETRGEIAGTLAYMAPEVLRGEPADARGDVWALGVVLYEMAAGRLPFSGKTAYDLTGSILREPLPALPARVPAGLRSVIQRCMAKEPGQRYPRIGEVRSALEAIGSSDTLAVVAAPPAEKSSRWRAARFLKLAGAVVLAALLYFISEGRFNGLLIPASSKHGGDSPSAGARTSTGGRASANREANEYFERGVEFNNNQKNSQRAMQMFERALELDPKFAEARGWHASTEVGMVDQGISNDSTWLYKAEEEARRALEDDPNCGQAHVARAKVYFFQGHKELIPGEVEKALKINPQNPTAKNWLAIYHYYSGNDIQAKAVWQEAIERDRLNVWIRLNLAELLRTEGEVQAALRETEKLIDQYPQDDALREFLAQIYTDSGDLRKARATFEAIRRTSPFEFRIKLTAARLLAAEGKRSDALREMDASLLKFLELDKWHTFEAAEVYAAVGETDKALDWLERAVNGSDERIEWFRRDPMLKNIRNLPRFEQILASVAARREQRKTAQPAQ